MSLAICASQSPYNPRSGHRALVGRALICQRGRSPASYQISLLSSTRRAYYFDLYLSLTAWERLAVGYSVASFKFRIPKAISSMALENIPL